MEILSLSDVIATLLGGSITCGVLIIAIPWLIGMVFAVFKKIVL